MWMQGQSRLTRICLALIDENGTVTAGEQEVTVKFLLPASVEQVNAVTVQVHLTQLAASNTDAQGDQ